MTNGRMTNGLRARRRGMGYGLLVMGYPGMRSVRRATHAPGAATSVAVRSEQAHGQCQRLPSFLGAGSRWEIEAKMLKS